MSQQARAMVQKQPGHPPGMPLHKSILQRAAINTHFTPVQSGILQCCSGGVECEECRQKRLGTLQRAAVNAAPENSVPPIVHDVLSSSGQPLDTGTRAFMEPRFGYDFSQVRVGTDSRTAESARAVNSLASSIGQDYSQRIWFDPQIDPRLPDYTPAWTENGNIHLSVSSFFMSPYERQRMLRHEAIHSFHQQLSHQSETADAREHAERLAIRGEQNFARLSFGDFLHPAPALLAYAPQKFSPWTTVWIGSAGIIVEVVEAGVSVRIFRSYDDIYHDIKTPESYVCGKPDTSPIRELEKKMQGVARKTAKLKAKFPKTAMEQQIALVVIQEVDQGYRVANGKGLVALYELSFKSEYEDVIAHEGAHAIFEFHSVHKDPAKRVPDALALRIADLYIELKQTKEVPTPTAKFDPNHPPTLAVTKKPPAEVLKSPTDPYSVIKDTYPAGILMVYDTLWSGLPGGHPWDRVDEFFASAYGGFLQQPVLLQQIVSHYQKADKNIKPLAEQLFKLLAMVGNPESLKKLAEPAKPKRAQEAIVKADLVPVLDESDNPRYNYLIYPSKMPTRETIQCRSSTPSPAQPAKKYLEDIPDDVDFP
jgi:uncharacterized protein DUF4157